MIKRLALLIIVAIIAGCIPAANYAVSPLASPKKYHVYLPQTWIRLAPPPPCYRTEQAKAFAKLLTTDTRQQRKVMRCNLTLNQAAQIRVESMAALGYFAHCDPVGICPNAIAIASGCRLPVWYPINGNNIESITAGARLPQVAFDSLARSTSHAKHIFGEIDFFREQTEVGIAYIEVPGSKYTYYWAIEIGICE